MDSFACPWFTIASMSVVMTSLAWTTSTLDGVPLKGESNEQATNSNLNSSRPKGSVVECRIT
jgi:hypothetical protein